MLMPNRLYSDPFLFFADAVQYDTNMIIEINGKLIDKLIEAAKIYSETFNVEVSISKTEGTKAEKLDHNIQEKVNGTTGMDKEYVRNLKVNHIQMKNWKMIVQKN